MSYFTKDPLQNIWRLTLSCWVLYCLFRLSKFVYLQFPLTPDAFFLAIPLQEPSYFAAFVHLILTLYLAILITVFPTLFVCGFVEDKFWPRATSSFPVTNKYPERTQR